MSKQKVNNASVIDACTQCLNALKAHLSSTKATIAVNGVQTKAAEIIATYQASLDGRATLNSQRANVKATLGTVAASDAKRRVVDRALKAWVINQFGVDTKEAHDFGFPPPKAPERTVSSKATALERSEAWSPRPRVTSRDHRFGAPQGLERRPSHRPSERPGARREAALTSLPCKS